MSVVLGDRLLLSAKAATGSVLLVAPFIKRAAMVRIAEALPALSLTCVTRWIPQEIADGVSDLEVWDLFKDRPDWALFLRSDLHAKYYRFGTVAFAGSANVTNKALGWCRNPNLELLLDINPACPEIETFEKELLSRAMRVNQHLVDRTAKTVAALKRLPANYPVAQPKQDNIDICDLEQWAPVSCHPARLFECYSGRSDSVITSVFEDGVKDLSSLGVPQGLSRSEFVAFVSTRIQQLPIVELIDVAATDGLGLDAGQAIADKVGIVNGSDGARTGSEWKNLRQWLVHFLHDRYREKHTERGSVFERAVVLSAVHLRPNQR